MPCLHPHLQCAEGGPSPTGSKSDAPKAEAPKISAPSLPQVPSLPKPEDLPKAAATNGSPLPSPQQVSSNILFCANVGSKSEGKMALSVFR